MRVLIFLVSIFSSYVISATALAAAPSSCPQQYCIAVVDVGSTGSRIHIYSYDLDDTHSPVAISERWSKKIKPGFATLEVSEQAINGYLTALLVDAPFDSIPLYFYATAGMRLLPVPQQEALCKLVNDWFKNQSQWHLMSAKTITGQQEGFFGWLAINYQLGTLTQVDEKAIGVLDMGGASVQLAFPLKNDETVNLKDVQEIDIYNQHIKLFVLSFLGLGFNEVARQFIDDSYCYSMNYPKLNDFSAAGDAYQCEKNIASFINKGLAVDQVVQPILYANPVNEWYAMGGVVELTSSKPFTFQGAAFTNKSLLEQANTRICHQQWPELKEYYTNNPYLSRYCLYPAYYYALMVEGYGISPETVIYHSPAHTASDWTIGVLFQQAAYKRKRSLYSLLF